MADINFQIPVTISSLLEENCEQYYIREVVHVKHLPKKLKEAKQLFKEEGAGYIVDNFDTYISVVLNASQVSTDIQMEAFEDLHRAIKELSRTLTFLFGDKEILDDEVKLKYLNIVKMLLYAYANIIITISIRSSSNLKSKKGKSMEDINTLPKENILFEINTILQQEIKILWDPPTVEEALVNQIAEICYNFIEKNTYIKSHKELCANIFNVFGLLLTDYRYSTRFVYRIAEVVKSYEHATTVVAEGIKLLIESYNVKSLLREFVRQITDWQVDDQYQNGQATRNCAHVLSEMAKIMPDLMIEETMYLAKYLNHESYTLRISVINVITEVTLTILSKSELTNEQQQSKDEFLEILSDHMLDVSAFVRAKAIQSWNRLQKENLLSTKTQIRILEHIIYHLRDKGSNVRKVAANCVTSFLEHNPFGSELKLKEMVATLEKEQNKYEEMKQKLCEPHFQKLKEAEETWNQVKDEISKIIENNLNEVADNDEEEDDLDTPESEIPNLVQKLLKEKKFEDALKLTKKATESIPYFSNLRDTIQHENEGEFLMKLLRNFFLDVHNQLMSLMDTDDENIQNLNKQQDLVKYYEDAVKFLEVLAKSMVPMRDLLDSVNISEMQEAVDFFIVTFKFSIDNALEGILAMLCIMQRPEQDRKVAITNALKAIFLETNANSMQQHSKIIVDRLIKFMDIVTFDKIGSFKLVVHNWVSEGKLDNNVIECIFQYFIKKHDVSDHVSLRALQLLTLIAPAKKTIVTKNLHMISELVFESRGINDMILFSETCKLITAGVSEQQLITDKKPPFKLKPSDSIWNHISNILCKHFDGKKPFYNPAIKNAVILIYTLCSKPDEICETLVMNILKKIGVLNVEEANDLPYFILIRLCSFLGELAICQLSFLDETVYKEIKRRLYVTAEKHNSKGRNAAKNKNVSSASLSRRNANTNSSTIVDDGDDSILEGAQADDAEADFILNILENKIVTSQISLGAFSPLIITICENPDKYDDEYLQCAAVLALLRYMLVSSKFCASYVRLIFTILEKTKYSEVKCIIVINLSDLLERFPNFIEPWSIHIYNRLNDKNLKVQKTTFHILANLLLRDMLRVKSDIAFMASFISEENNDLSNMSKNFFSALSVKDNHLYNVLPDIFSHLVNAKEINENQFRFIMKHLINLITSARHTENLVDRFCIKFHGTEEPYICRNIAYCLSLLQYNEKAVKKLSENFSSYKHILHDPDVYSFIKHTMNSWSKLVKNDMKAIVTELEEKINSVFQVTENGEGGPDNISRPVFKKPRVKSVRKHKKRIQSHDDSGSDEEVQDTSSLPTPTRRSNRTRSVSKFFDE